MQDASYDPVYGRGCPSKLVTFAKIGYSCVFYLKARRPVAHLISVTGFVSLSIQFGFSDPE